LGCPVGSLLAGSSPYIREARRWRKMVGGGMRQSGVIAAAGIIALEQMVDRLADDHRNARRLAEGLARLPGIHVAVEDVQTNIIMVQLDSALDAAEFVAGMGRLGVMLGGAAGGRMRMVTHYQITAEDVDYVISAAESVLDLVPAAGA
jgi:threonine aldolase